MCKRKRRAVWISRLSLLFPVGVVAWFVYTIITPHPSLEIVDSYLFTLVVLLWLLSSMFAGALIRWESDIPYYASAEISFIVGNIVSFKACEGSSDPDDPSDSSRSYEVNVKTITPQKESTVSIPVKKSFCASHALGETVVFAREAFLNDDGSVAEDSFDEAERDAEKSFDCEITYFDPTVHEYFLRAKDNHSVVFTLALPTELNLNPSDYISVAIGKYLCSPYTLTTLQINQFPQFIFDSDGHILHTQFPQLVNN